MNTKEMMIDTIEYMENHITEEISLDQVATHFHYSKYHYTRLFKEVFGENIGDYHRKRCLTMAAEQLLHTEDGILGIALDNGYQSQEAFTRIFKAYFGITPKQYRKQGWAYLNLYKNAISVEDVQELFIQKVVDFRIEHKEAFEVIGISYHGKNDKHNAAHLFNQAVKSLHFEQIYNQVDGLYGVDYCEGVHLRDEEFDFLAGIDYRNYGPKNRQEETVSDPVNETVTDPALVTKSIPENDYAVFELTPMIERIPEQIHRIYRSFLQNDTYMLCDSYGLEFYPKGFVPNQKGVPAYLYLPVKRA